MEHTFSFLNKYQCKQSFSLNQSVNQFILLKVLAYQIKQNICFDNIDNNDDIKMRTIWAIIYRRLNKNFNESLFNVMCISIIEVINNKNLKILSNSKIFNTNGL